MEPEFIYLNPTFYRKEVYNIMRRAFNASLSLLLLVAWCRGASVADNNDTKSNQQVPKFVADLFGEAPAQTDDSKSQQEGSMKGEHVRFSSTEPKINACKTS